MVKHKLAVSFFDIDRISDNSGSITPFKGERKTLGYTATYTFNETTLWTFGLDHMAEETATASADINSAYAEVAFAASDKLDLTGSLRYDDHSDLGGQATGRLAAAYRFSDDVILRAQAATGYKPPSLFQSTTNAAKSTVALAPEDNTTFELGLEKTYGEVGFVRVTAFYNDLRNHLVYESS